MVYKAILVTCLLVLNGFTSALCAIDFSLPQVTTFYKHQYQASNRNWCIDHGNDGYVYIGNDQGLLSFDGVQWTLNELPAHSRVRSICVASDGLIYTGSSEEIGFWQRNAQGQLYYTSINNKLLNVTFHNQEIWRIYEDTEHNIVFQGFSMTLKFDGEQVQKVEVNNPPTLLEKHDKRLWGNTRRGELLELTPYGYQKVLQSDLLRQRRLKAVVPYKDGAALLLTKSKGVFVWNGDALQSWQVPANEQLVNEDINCAVFHDGYYYVGTIHSGLLIINSEGEIVYKVNTHNYLQDNTILSLKFDAHNRLWFTMSVGIGYLELDAPLKLLVDSEKRIGAVHSVAYHQERLYLATNKGVWYKSFMPGEQLLSFDGFKQLAELQGLAWVVQVMDDQLLCSHNKGTFLIDNNEVHKITAYAGGRSFQKIKVKGKEYLLQNTYSDLVVLEKGPDGRWQFKSTVEGFSEPTMSLAVDHKNQIWLQHDRKSELYNIRLQHNLRDAYSYNVYTARHGLPKDMQSEVYEFNKRIIITSSEGVYTYDGLKDSIVYYQELNQRLGAFKSAHKIIKQNQDAYWLINNNSLALFRTKDGSISKVLQYKFVEPHLGLVENFENIITIDSLASFICMENGLGIYYHNDLLQNSEQNVYGANVRLSYQAGGKEVSLVNPSSNTITLPNANQDFKVSVATLASPGRQMEYHLDVITGADSISYQGGEPEFNLGRLPQNMSYIRILAYDQWGKATEEKLINIVVLKPWYLKTGVIIIWCLIALSLLLLLLLRFKRNLNKYLIPARQEINTVDATEVDELKQLKTQLEDEVIQQNTYIATGALNAIRNKEVLATIKKELTAQKEKLGIRYPDKYYKKLVDLIESNMHNEDDWAMFEQHFDKANNNFITRLKQLYPQLTPRDLRLCAYLKMNLSSKEIAPFLDISERSVEVHRYRLRKKLNLPAESNLAEFMISF
ncbi:hypothetical protein KEM09_02655 [Carboxylicivirga mesophila]|uniref:HTH luxR-type domain-containing protein n=1 Tax=Carboxylicivirga mesophila TaxID=1166478 RepID=A0ABS5K5N1_9BACT|nr:LuxR C-terminal-related transcriptional regulator [Carboxylicivirga mesophila]MBS2210280.1 hypothetical protein [Carboxylicivirga mesophila]